MKFATALVVSALGSACSYTFDGARPRSQTKSRASAQSTMQIGVKTDKGLDERYAQIAAALPRQQAAYAKWMASIDGPKLVATTASLGLDLDLEGGQVSYAADFESKRVPLCFDFVYCRHGKTTGNTEPRVYQGYVDEPSNALNEIGLAQAQEAADKLDALSLDPDLIVLSPLSRAAETGLA
jgi:hypothetical protein